MMWPKLLNDSCASHVRTRALLYVSDWCRLGSEILPANNSWSGSRFSGFQAVSCKSQRQEFGFQIFRGVHSPCVVSSLDPLVLSDHGTTLALLKGDKHVLSLEQTKGKGEWSTGLRYHRSSRKHDPFHTYPYNLWLSRKTWALYCRSPDATSFANEKI